MKDEINYWDLEFLVENSFDIQLLSLSEIDDILSKNEPYDLYIIKPTNNVWVEKELVSDRDDLYMFIDKYLSNL